MASSRWFKDPKLIVPAVAAVVVALIGLAGAVWTSRSGNSPAPAGDSEAAAGEPVADASPEESSEPPAAPRELVVVVIDGASGDRVLGARILFDEQGLSEETDDTGRARLSIRPDLEAVRLTVEATGYQAQNLEIDVFEQMDPIRVRLLRE